VIDIVCARNSSSIDSSIDISIGNTTMNMNREKQKAEETISMLQAILLIKGGRREEEKHNSEGTIPMVLEQKLKPQNREQLKLCVGKRHSTTLPRSREYE